MDSLKIELFLKNISSEHLTLLQNISTYFHGNNFSKFEKQETILKFSFEQYHCLLNHIQKKKLWPLLHVILPSVAQCKGHHTEQHILFCRSIPSSLNTHPDHFNGSTLTEQH